MAQSCYFNHCLNGLPLMKIPSYMVIVLTTVLLVVWCAGSRLLLLYLGCIFHSINMFSLIPSSRTAWKLSFLHISRKVTRAILLQFSFSGVRIKRLVLVVSNRVFSAQISIGQKHVFQMPTLLWMVLSLLRHNTLLTQQENITAF